MNTWKLKETTNTNNSIVRKRYQRRQNIKKDCYYECPNKFQAANRMRNTASVQISIIHTNKKKTNKYLQTKLSGVSLMYIHSFERLIDLIRLFSGLASKRNLIYTVFPKLSLKWMFAIFKQSKQDTKLLRNSSEMTTTWNIKYGTQGLHFGLGLFAIIISIQEFCFSAIWIVPKQYREIQKKKKQITNQNGWFGYNWFLLATPVLKSKIEFN